MAAGRGRPRRGPARRHRLARARARWSSTSARPESSGPTRSSRSGRRCCPPSRAKGRIILLTKLQQGDLGNDVVARLARSRLFPIDHWASLCALFKAKELDRSICDPAIAQALIEYAPPDGYPPVSAGILDAGTVWRAISRHVFDMGESEPDLVSLLLWATTKSGPARYLDASDELRASLRQRLMDSLGDAADSILRFIESGAGADALALAVVCQVVFGEGDRTRRSTPPPPGWSSTTTTSRSPSRGPGLGPCRRRCHRRSGPQGRPPARPAATSSGPTNCCGSSAARTTPTATASPCSATSSGWPGSGRRSRRPSTLRARRRSGSASSSRHEVADHRIAKLGTTRGAGLPDRDGPAARPLARSAAVAGSDVVRRAGRRLPQGAGVRRLGTGVRSAGARRSPGSPRRTSSSIRRCWHAGRSSTGPSPSRWRTGPRWARTFTGVCGVEDVLSQVVAKVAEAGQPGAADRPRRHELGGLPRTARRHPAGALVRGDPRRVVVAARCPSSPPIPSVTNYSRASLLSGRLTNGRCGGREAELRGAPGAEGSAATGSIPPVLFHKKEVTEGSRGVVGRRPEPRPILSAKTTGSSAWSSTPSTTA